MFLASTDLVLDGWIVGMIGSFLLILLAIIGFFVRNWYSDTKSTHEKLNESIDRWSKSISGMNAVIATQQVQMDHNFKEHSRFGLDMDRFDERMSRYSMRINDNEKISRENKIEIKDHEHRITKNENDINDIKGKIK